MQIRSIRKIAKYISISYLIIPLLSILFPIFKVPLLFIFITENIIFTIIYMFNIKKIRHNKKLF